MIMKPTEQCNTQNFNQPRSPASWWSILSEEVIAGLPRLSGAAMVLVDDPKMALSSDTAGGKRSEEIKTCDPAMFTTM